LSSALEAPSRQSATVAHPNHASGDLLANWCDRVFGTGINEQINREMIKWCEAFLDEGHATWRMPGREKGFYAAWKFLAQREWSPCGIKNSREKLARLPEHAEDSLLESLGRLGVPAESWHDYLSSHLAALSGWTGFIKWRADQSEYDWQSAYPIDLVHYLAARLWYERELVHQACRQAWSIDGNFDAISTELQKRGDSAGAMFDDQRSHRVTAWKLMELARTLELEPDLLTQSPNETLRILVQWIDSFPEAAHGPVWLEAFEGQRNVRLRKSPLHRKGRRITEDSRLRDPYPRFGTARRCFGGCPLNRAFIQNGPR
jgi:hypothetical protein